MKMWPVFCNAWQSRTTLFLVQLIHLLLPTLVKAKQSLMSVCMIETTTITTALLHLNHGMSQVLKWEGRNMASKYVKDCLGTLTTLYKNRTMKFGLDIQSIIQSSVNQSCVSLILSRNLRILIKIFNLTLKCITFLGANQNSCFTFRQAGCHFGIGLMRFTPR